MPMHKRGTESASITSCFPTPHPRCPQLPHYPHLSRLAHVCSSQIRFLGHHFRTRTISVYQQHCKSSTLIILAILRHLITCYAWHGTSQWLPSLLCPRLRRSRSLQGLRRPMQVPFWEPPLVGSQLERHRLSY